MPFHGFHASVRGPESRKVKGSVLDIGYSLLSFISRYDQIVFQLDAAADQGGRHFTDLRKLNLASEELLAAARWTFTQNVSDAFRQGVVEVLQALGHGDLHERL
jgi:hypothetical protein